MHVHSKQINAVSASTRVECESKAAAKKAIYYAFSASSKLCQVSQTCDKATSKVDWVVYQLCVMPETTLPPLTGPIKTEFKQKSTTCSSADMCVIDNAKECSQAARELHLKDYLASGISAAKALGGCFFDGKSLYFNNEYKHSKGKHYPSASSKLICKPCPYVSPYCKREKLQAKCKVIYGRIYAYLRC